MKKQRNKYCYECAYYCKSHESLTLIFKPCLTNRKTWSSDIVKRCCEVDNHEFYHMMVKLPVNDAKKSNVEVDGLQSYLEYECNVYEIDEQMSIN